MTSKGFNITREQLEKIICTRDDIGLELCFNSDISWEEIKDTEFHRLHRLYIKASTDLKNYLEEAGVQLGLGEGNF